MALGMLDIDDPNVGYGAFGMPDVPRDQITDYSLGFPTKQLAPSKKKEQLLDEDLARFRETAPVAPIHMPQMDAQQPLPGMLNQPGGPLNSIQPPQQPLQPGAPAPALPPPINVGASPAGNAPPTQMAPGGGSAVVPPPAVAGAAPTDVSGRSRDLAAPTIAPQQPGMLERFDKFTQRNPALLFSLAAGFSGAPSFGTGMSRAFGGAVQGSQIDRQNAMQLDQQRTAYHALVQAGMPAQQAVAAAQNPEIFKLVAPDYLGTRKSEIKVVKDSLGNERLVAVNPYMSQEDIDKAAGAGGAASSLTGGPDTGGLARMPVEIDPATGRDEKFLEAFRKADPINAAGAESILNGNAAGTGRNLQQLQKYAQRIDPSFNQATYNARNNLYKSYYGGGEGFKQLRSANTAIDHGMQLRQAIENLHNFTVLPGVMNPVTRTVEAQFSGPYQDALKDFESARAVYAHELETALTGKSTVSGYKEIHDLFDKDASPESNMSALRSTLGKLQSRVEEHESSYNRGMGGKASTQPVKDFITNRGKLDALLNRGALSAQDQARAAGIVVVNGKQIPWSAQ